MANKQELFTKVTGLTYDVEKITDEKKLSWLIPGGAMLKNAEGRKTKDTEEFKSVAGLSSDSNYDDVEDPINDTSFDDDPKSTVVIDGDDDADDNI